MESGPRAGASDGPPPSKACMRSLSDICLCSSPQVDKDGVAGAVPVENVGVGEKREGGERERSELFSRFDVTGGTL